MHRRRNIPLAWQGGVNIQWVLVYYRCSWPCWFSHQFSGYYDFAWSKWRLGRGTLSIAAFTSLYFPLTETATSYALFRRTLGRWTHGNY